MFWSSSGFSIPSNGEAAFIFSCHLLAGQFFSLESLFPLIQFQPQKKKTAWVSPGRFSSSAEWGLSSIVFLIFSLPALTKEEHFILCYPAHSQERCAPSLGDLTLSHLLWGKAERIGSLNSLSKGVITFCTYKDKSYLENLSCAPTDKILLSSIFSVSTISKVLF